MQAGPIQMRVRTLRRLVFKVWSLLSVWPVSRAITTSRRKAWKSGRGLATIWPSVSHTIEKMASTRLGDGKMPPRTKNTSIFHAFPIKYIGSGYGILESRKDHPERRTSSSYCVIHRYIPTEVRSIQNSREAASRCPRQKAQVVLSRLRICIRL